MPRALWLLLWLKLIGWMRLLKRMVKSVKGVLVLLVSLGFLSIWGVSIFAFPPDLELNHLEKVRHYGPPAILLFCLLNLLLASGEQAISFRPAEVDLLFAGPFTRRQVLTYKIVSTFFASLFSGVILAVALRPHTAGILQGLLGATLTILFLQLFSIALALLIGLVGKAAYDRRRKLLLGLVVLLAGGLAWQQGAENLERPWLALVDELLAIPAVQVLLTPFRWLIEVDTAPAYWPDLVLAVGKAVAVIGVMLLLVFALDRSALEVAALASEKMYARLQALSRSGTAGIRLSSATTATRSLPSPPHWGGVGPLMWRQAVAATRSLWWLFILAIITGSMLVPIVMMPAEQSSRPESLLPALGMLLCMLSLLVPQLMPFDFRGDLDRIEYLKTLPLPTWRLVVGQLLTPILMLSIVEAALIIVLQLVLNLYDLSLCLLIPLLPALNLLFFAIENFFFLLFPTRQVASSPGDFQFMGRHMLLWLCKLLSLAVIAGVAAVAGVLVYLVIPEMLASLLAAALTVAVLALAWLPLVCWAFVRFDVARDTPP